MYFLLSIFVAIILVVSLSSGLILSTFIVLGHAHFLIAYIYTYKAGKMNNAYLNRFLMLLISIGFLCQYIFLKRNQNYINFLTMLTLLVFVIHYVNDEFKISYFTHDAVRRLAIISVFFSFASLFLIKIFDIQKTSFLVFLPIVLSLSFGALFSYYFFNNYKKTRNALSLSIFFIFNVGIPLSLVFWFPYITIYQIAGCIIFFHYTRWYVRYFDFFRGKVLKNYLYIIFFTHCLYLALFVMYTFFFMQNGFLSIFFTSIFFYGWTLIHIIMSKK